MVATTLKFKYLMGTRTAGLVAAAGEQNRGIASGITITFAIFGCNLLAANVVALMSVWSRRDRLFQVIL